MRNHRFAKSLTFAACLLGLATAATLWAQSGSIQCNQVAIKGPRWISSALWSQEKKAVAAVDTLGNRVLFFSPDGKTQPAETLAARQGFLPAEILYGPDGYLLKLIGIPVRMMKLGADFEVKSEVDLSKRIVPDAVHSIYQAALAGNDLVGYGTVSRAGQGSRPFRAGFFRTSAELTSKAELLLPYDDGDYYVLGHQYVTSIGSTAYFVLMDQKPAIYKAARGQKVTPLNIFPAEYEQAPKLRSPMDGPRDAEPLFREVEGLTIPVGLYSNENMLYLLTRKPDGADKTVWSIFQIDPKDEQIKGAVTLPTRAHHLSLVPSPKAWYAIERGAVRDVGVQEISRMVEIPASWITSPTMSPLNAQSTKVKECPAKGN